MCTGGNADGELLWQNPAPNSALTQRPLCVIGAKEDKEVLRPLISLIEGDILQVTQNGFNMTFEGRDIHVSVNSSLTMFDGKMHGNLQQTFGAFCQIWMTFCCPYWTFYCQLLLLCFPLELGL